jgi:hypothetical protein
MKKVCKYLIVVLLFFSSCRSNLDTLEFPQNASKIRTWIPSHIGSSEELELKEKDILGNIFFFPRHLRYSDRGKVLVHDMEGELLCIDDTRDSIYETFVIASIDTVKYAYIRDGDTLRHKKVYKINTFCISDTNLKWRYPILSIAEEENAPQIEVGKEYKLLMISYFSQDRLSTGYYYNVLLNDVYMILVPIPVWGVNFYTTPNLKGLHYHNSE